MILIVVFEYTLLTSITAFNTAQSKLKILNLFNFASLRENPF